MVVGTFIPQKLLDTVHEIVNIGECSTSFSEVGSAEENTSMEPNIAIYCYLQTIILTEIPIRRTRLQFFQ
jgi:hypothetical protein